MNKNLKLIILIIIVISSLVLEITGISVEFGSAYPYIIKPLIWIFIGIITFVFFKNDVIVNKKYKKDVNFLVLVTTLVYFLIYFVLGYVKGFAHNPYDSSLRGILTNLWTFLPVLFIREYVRYFMINNCEKKRILWWTLWISIMFTLVEVNIYKFDSYFETSLTTIEFFMETLMPALLTYLYLTYICYFSGYTTSIIYALLPQLALYLLPILPDIDWAILAILNSAVPFFSYIYINYTINKIDKTTDRREVKVVGIKGWLSMIAVVFLMICFGTGVFPIEPLVIASNSMAPEFYRGDIVIIQDTDVKKVKKGDIIRYKMEGYYVVHRVVKIEEDEYGTRSFIMKGDNNEDIDLYPVRENQFAGTIKFDIPYLGYPTLILGELLNTNVDDKVTVDKGRTN